MQGCVCGAVASHGDAQTAQVTRCRAAWACPIEVLAAGGLRTDRVLLHSTWRFCLDNPLSSCCCRWKEVSGEDPARMEARLLAAIDYPVNVVKN